VICFLDQKFHFLLKVSALLVELLDLKGQQLVGVECFQFLVKVKPWLFQYYMRQI
jgi:hypothetical protein